MQHFYSIMSNTTPSVCLFVAKSGYALSQDEQGVVYVARFLQPLAKRLGFVTSFRAGQVTQRKPNYDNKKKMFKLQIKCYSQPVCRVCFEWIRFIVESYEIF